jgi:hypothetical protein
MALFAATVMLGSLADKGFHEFSFASIQKSKLQELQKHFRAICNFTSI